MLRRYGRISLRDSLVMSFPSKMIRPERRLEQLENAAHERRLAATGLADDPERLAFVETEGHAVDRLDRGYLTLEDDSPRDGEVLDEVLDDEQLIAGSLGRRHDRVADAEVTEELGGSTHFRRIVEVTRLLVVTDRSGPAREPARAGGRRPS